MWRGLCRAACVLPLWGWSVATVALVLWLTLSPDPLPDSDMSWPEGADKVVHGLMFLGVYLSLCFDITRRLCGKIPGRIADRPTRINLVGWVMLLGAVIEIMQPLSGRTCDLADFIADAAGALSGLAVSGWLMRRLWGRHR